MINRTAAPRVKITFIGILALFFIIGFCYLACAGGSHNPLEIIGKWKGSIDSPPIGVELEVMEDGADLDYFGGNRDCSAWAMYVDHKDNTHIYTLKAEQGGSLQGWCKKLRDETMTLTHREDGTLELHIAIENEGIDETVNLEKKQ